MFRPLLVILCLLSLGSDLHAQFAVDTNDASELRERVLVRRLRAVRSVEYDMDSRGTMRNTPELRSRVEYYPLPRGLKVLEIRYLASVFPGRFDTAVKFYDSAFHLQRITRDDGTTPRAIFTYNQRGALTEVFTPDPDYGYAPFSDVTAASYRYSYDDAGRVSAVDLRDSLSVTIGRVEYCYSADGHMTRECDLARVDSLWQIRRELRRMYDDRGRVALDSTLLDGKVASIVRYTYSTTNDLLEEVSQSLQDHLSTRTVFDYDGGHHLLRKTSFDQRTGKVDSWTAYTYDHRAHLTRRRSQTGGEELVYEPNGNMVESIEMGLGNLLPSGRLQYEYTYEP